MLSAEEIDALHQRLHVHRFTLSTLLNQKTMFGPAYVPPVVLLGIRDNRSSIKHIKDVLRAEGIEVEDREDDFEPVDQAIPPGSGKESQKTQPTASLSEEELASLWEEAEQAFKKQDWEKAEPLLLQVAAVNPRYREVQRLLSRTKKYLGLLVEYRKLCALDDSLWREAKSRFDFIRRESSNFPDKQNLLGWIELQEWSENQYEIAEELVGDGNITEAKEILEGILERNPDNRQANDLMQVVTEIEEEETSRQRQIELMERKARAKELWEIRQKEEASRKDAELAIGVIVVLVILIVIASNMPH